MKNTKGLSDVVSTVLIILLVVAAVAIVGSIVLRNVSNTGQKVDAGTVCASTLLEVTNCAPSATSISVKRTSTAGYTLTAANVLKQDGGLAAPGNVIANLSSDGAIYTAGALSATAPPTTSAYMQGLYTVNGVTVTCSYPPRTCA